MDVSNGTVRVGLQEELLQDPPQLEQVDNLVLELKQQQQLQGATKDHH
jgi:hypothetical protein